MLSRKSVTWSSRIHASAASCSLFTYLQGRFLPFFFFQALLNERVQIIVFRSWCHSILTRVGRAGSRFHGLLHRVLHVNAHAFEWNGRVNRSTWLLQLSWHLHSTVKHRCIVARGSWTRGGGGKAVLRWLLRRHDRLYQCQTQAITHMYNATNYYDNYSSLCSVCV